MTITITGIDPGIVHTGVVAIGLDAERRVWTVDEIVVPGVQLPHPSGIGTTPAVDVYSTIKLVETGPDNHVFIEAYRPRSHFAHDASMVSAVRELATGIPGAKVINNTGVKQVVGQQLMQLFSVWKFATSTHHQDLRSAARIGIYGALKDTELNAVLTQFVTDNLDGRVWTRTATAYI